jgi:hypothetical protein
LFALKLALLTQRQQVHGPAILRFNMLTGKSRITVRMKLLLVIVPFLLFVGCGRSVLPPDQAIMSLSEAELRSLVLAKTPIGMSRSGVEKVLAHTFRRQWHVVDYQVRDLVSKRGFTVPVNGGDYYFYSDFAAIPETKVTSDVVTVYFLFSPTHQLKDVAVTKWGDGP